MPSTCCCVPGCSGRGGHSFPRDPKLLKMWILAIRRDSTEHKFKVWEPSRNSVVCRDHFRSSDYISETIFGTTPTKKQLKRVQCPAYFFWTQVSSTNEKEVGTLRSGREYAVASASSSQELIIYADEDIKVEETMECETASEPTLELKSEEEGLEQMAATSAFTQIPVYPLLSVDNFVNDNAGILFYTGLSSYYEFIFVLFTLGEAAYHLNYQYNNVDNLSIKNQFFLTFIKLRQHKTNFELSRLFNISEFSVSNIWITWINFMTHQWRELNIWPDRDVVKYFCPSDFKSKFPTTRVIVDGTECPVKKPKPPIAQHSTFSTYKNRNTIKVLAGATPGGLVSYLSPAYGGSSSDRQIVERSNLTTACDPGDSIMADKGFNVQDIFAPYDVTINIPTFFSKKNRMSGKAVLRDRKISSKRVHIERIIGLA